MPKATRSVFNPTRYDTRIGGSDYIIEPAPLENILEFDDVVKELSGQFDDLADKHFVTSAEGDDIAGPFDTYAEAEAHIKDNELEGAAIRVEGVPIRKVLDRLVSSPYRIMKPLVPSLKEEDARKMSFPEMKFIFGLLIEVNGFEWFETMLKNLMGSLLPRISDLTAGTFLQGMQGALRGSTGAKAGPSGETESTTS